MSLPLVVVANADEKKKAQKIFKNHQIKVIGEGFYQVLIHLKEISKKQPIINFGMAGSAGFKIGEKVEIGTSKLLHVGDFKIKDKTFKLSNSGVVCYTANSFVTKNETKLKKCVFDMELYYILALGYNVVKSVKIISDNLSLKQYHKY
mgnify:CR=1 FL=1